MLMYYETLNTRAVITQLQNQMDIVSGELVQLVSVIRQLNDTR